MDSEMGKESSENVETLSSILNVSSYSYFTERFLFVQWPDIRKEQNEIKKRERHR